MQNETIILIIVVVGFLVALLIIVFIAAMLVAYHKKGADFERQLEEMKHNFRQELLQSKLDIQEQTLLTISRDMHDNIGQGITLVKRCLDNQKVEGAAEEIRLLAIEDLAKVLQDVRDLSKSLSLELIKSHGLTYAIENLIDRLRRRNNYKMTFQTVGKYDVMDEQREIFIFRILQEALSNIMRHSGATEIYVLLDTSSSRLLKLVVKDNGIGFKSETLITKDRARDAGGIGHMINRVKLIDGEITLRSSPGKGTSICITLPYKPIYESNQRHHHHSPS